MVNRCCGTLGDNIFFGHGLSDLLGRAGGRDPRRHVFAYRVRDPERYGVVELDAMVVPSASRKNPSGPARAMP